jgi:hypothetical protein
MEDKERNLDILSCTHSYIKTTKYCKTEDYDYPGHWQQQFGNLEKERNL